MASIYKLISGDTEAYIVALSLIHALQVFCEQNGLSIDDLGAEDQIKEVFPSSWSRIKFEKQDDYGKTLSMNLNLYMETRKDTYEVIFEQ